MAQYHCTAIVVAARDERIFPSCCRLYRIRDGSTEEEAGQGLKLQDCTAKSIASPPNKEYP